MVMGIIACLASLLMPALSAMRQKADSVACVSNLRQIGIAAQLYAGENSQTTPMIEPWPSDPVYPNGDGAQTILASLHPDGVTAAT
jgi:type II secretory pathway pseudopilin PulG